MLKKQNATAHRDELKERQDTFVKRAPRKYRTAIILVFRTLVKEYRERGDELADPENILEDMASYSEMSIYDLDHFKSKLQHIIYGETKGTKKDNITLFEHIESFVWRYAPDEIASLDLLNEIYFFSKGFKSFVSGRSLKTTAFNLNADIGKKVEKVDADTITTIRLKSLDQNTIYKFDHKNGEYQLKHHALKSESAHPELIDTFYLAIKKSQYFDLPIAILFSNTNKSEFCIGGYFDTNNLVILKTYKNNSPVFIEYFGKNPALNFVKNKPFSMQFKTNTDISPFGVLPPISNPNENHQYWNFSSIVTVDDESEKREAISKALKIFRSLREHPH